MKNYLIDLNSTFKNLDNVYAHVNKNGKETLKEHLETTFKYFIKLYNIKNLDVVFDNIINKLTNKEEDKELTKELLYNCIYLHDIGKINPAFQAKLLNNKENIKKYNKLGYNSNHSLLSAVIFIDLFKKKIDRKNKLAKTILAILAYVISKHHGQLNDTNYMGDFADKIELLKQENINYTEGYYDFKISGIKIDKKLVEKFNIEFYILTRLVFALLTGSDFYATGEYVNDLEITEFGIITDDFFKDYTNGQIYNGITEYEKDKKFFNGSINGLRSDIFLEAQKNLENNLNSNIFYLEAPTGSGKTNTSINLARILVENDKLINKVFYIFPFNTLIEQTAEVFRNTFNVKDYNKIGLINSITPIKEIENCDGINYELSLLYKQFLNYPITMTSHVGLFNYLFGVGRQQCFPLINMCNSVIIIDEVQAYNNEIWKQIIVMFEKYSELLNIKFIIMSATLPKLSLLSGYNGAKITELLNDTSIYYNNSYFKDRVTCDFSLLDNTYRDGEPEDLEKLVDDIIDKIKNRETKTCKVLIEFITKRNCYEFTKMLKQKINNIEIITITSSDTKFKRAIKINKIKTTNEIIVVATQVIEAGVDIDVDLGFKNISIVENEEQFLGRINRSCKKKNCKCYFFKLYEAKKLYRKDVRVNINLLDKTVRDYLISKDFTPYFNKVFNSIINKLNIHKGTTTIWEKFMKNLSAMNFIEIKKIMQLIDSNQETLYLPLKVSFNELPENVINNYIELCGDNSGNVDGRIVFEKYKEINKSFLPYAKKMVLLSKIKELMICFTYTVFLKEEELDKSMIVKKELGMYYIDNIDKYINDNGEVELEKLLSLIKTGLSEEDLFI